MGFRDVRQAVDEVIRLSSVRRTFSGFRPGPGDPHFEVADVEALTCSVSTQRRVPWGRLKRWSFSRLSKYAGQGPGLAAYPGTRQSPEWTENRRSRSGMAMTLDLSLLGLPCTTGLPCTPERWALKHYWGCVIDEGPAYSSS